MWWTIFAFSSPCAELLAPELPPQAVSASITTINIPTPRTNLINAGIYVFEPSVLERIPSGEIWSAERQLFPGLVDEGAALYATAIDSYWMDVGTPEKYLRANLDALAGRFRDPEVVGAGEGLSLLGEGTVVAADARISSACLGSRSEVGSKATIERSVTLPRVKVGGDDRRW